MPSPTEEFGSSFHSLIGVTVGERRKNLFLLLNKIQASFRDEIDFSSIHPKTPLEETFKVDALIYFRRIPELLDVLKSENPILIRKVLKISPWFLEQAFGSVSGDELVTLVFPYVSFNVKVKIVNKLSVYLGDARKADLLFEAILQKYGMYLALKLLPSCSKDFIMQIVKNCRAQLSSKQLLIIVKKYPELSELILSSLSSCMGENGVTDRYRNVFVYLAKTHNGLFLDLYDKYKPDVKLGWRATHKFICSNKEIVIRDANNFYKFLHKSQSSKTLKQDFGDFYLNLFPAKVGQFSHKFTLLHSFIRKFRTDEEKLNLLEETFRKRYSSELLEHPGCLSLALLDLLPLSKRESIRYKPSHISEDQWNCYMRIEESISYLKNRITLSSDVNSRQDLIVNLVQTCRINRDLKALAEVCKYVVNRHRNDHASVRKAFLTTLHCSFELQTLNEEHWTHINELMEIFDMNGEGFPSSTTFLVAYILHRLLKKQDIRLQLTKYLKSDQSKWNLFENKPVFEKECLLLTWELLPQIFDDDTLKGSHIIFLNSLVDWNNRHPEDEISLFDYSAAVDSFKEIAIKFIGTSNSERMFLYLVKVQPDDSDLLRLCLSKLNLYLSDRNLLSRLMHCRPLIVLNNVDIISEEVFNFYNRFFWRQCRNYSHLEIPKKFGNACLDALAADVPGRRGDFIKQRAIIGLSYLMNANTFLEFASDYYPTELRADALDDESKKRYILQKTIASSLKNVIPPSLALESILNFSKGDYLKLIQSSLYSVSGNVNEDKLPPFFGDLGKRAVSVRKHCFHLSLRVLERSRVFTIFKKFMETEKNSSIRKFLLKGSFNLFAQDPSDNLWELVKSNISAVNADDREVVQILTEINKIPLSYMVRYILFMWEFLGNLPDPDGINEIEKFRLLHSLSVDIIRMLPKTFCSEIIEKYLFKFDYAKETTCNIDSFTCKFIIYCCSEIEQEALINAILPVLKNYLCQDKWSNIADKFLRQFCSEFLERKCPSRQILFTFTVLWNSYVKPFEAFDHYLYMQFCLIYIDSVNESLPPAKIGENLAKLINSLSDVYGTAVVSVISDVLISFVRYFLQYTRKANETSRYLLIGGMIKGNVSQACRLTAITLFKRNVEYSESQLMHNDLIQFLNQLNDPLIQIHLNHHIYRM